MDWLVHLEYAQILTLTLVLTRISGLMIAAPLYGDQQVPAQIRVLIAFALSLLIWPTQWNQPVPWPGSLLNGLVCVGSELVIGLSLGMGLQILFTGIQLAGQIIAQVGGQALAEAYNPSIGENTPVLAQLLYMVALAVFLTVGGHRVVLAGLLDTFHTLPLGHCGFPGDIPQTFVTMISQSFDLALRAAAPTATALLLATLVLGLVGRTIPQLNIMVLGFGANALVLSGVLCLSLGAAICVFREQVEPAIATLLDALHARPGG